MVHTRAQQVESGRVGRGGEGRGGEGRGGEGRGGEGRGGEGRGHALQGRQECALHISTTRSRPWPCSCCFSSSGVKICGTAFPAVMPWPPSPAGFCLSV